MPEATQKTPGELGKPPDPAVVKPPEATTPVAQAGKAGTPEGTAKPQTPSEVEQLKAQLAANTTELTRKEKEILRLQGIGKKSISRDEFLTMSKKIDDTQEYFAEMMDNFATQQLGEPEETKTGRKSYKDELQSRRAAQAKAAPAANPEAQVFWAYMLSQGLTLEDADVKEALQEDREPKEALEFLKDKQEAKLQAKIEKKAQEKADAIVEAKFKALGLASSGAGSPSMARGDASHLSPDQKLAKGFEQYNKKQ